MRLRARLESAASTAVRTPVLAVIEYNYEREGEIIVPAGAKAVGYIRNGDRSGYVDVQFDSLLMPDGAVVPLEAAATDLDLRPLKGKVEGQMSDDFGSDEPSLSVIRRDELNGAEPLHFESANECHSSCNDDVTISCSYSSHGCLRGIYSTTCAL